jgi:hypothetical protein
MVFKMANVLKDPKRFGVSRAIRDQLYDLMIKTLNYIVISDPASFARFRTFLMNNEATETNGIHQEFKKMLEETSRQIYIKKTNLKENEMDKIEQYKNLNEQVNKMLRDAEGVDPLSLQEEIHHTAAEICEALQDPNRVTALMQSGLIDSGRVARVRNALKDPEKAMKNSAVRSDLINMLMSLINIVTSNPSAYASVKKGARNMSKEPEPVEEELVGGQKKLDVNKNNKIDSEDLRMLRSRKKTKVNEETLSEGGISGALDDWLEALPKKVIAEIKAKYGKKLKAADLSGGITINDKDRQGIRQILVNNKVKPLLGDKSHAEGTSAVIMSFNTFHGDLTEGSDDSEEGSHKEPKGEKGQAAVERLGRDYKTGGFEKIAAKAAEKYGSKEAGERVAGAIYWKKVAARNKGG